MLTYNSLTQQKEPLVPLVPGKLGIYICGVTVYDYCHIGHARMFIVADLVVRYLRYSNYNVHYVRNITDVDDKIIHKALASGKSWQEVTSYYIEAMQQDERALNVLPPDEEPKATEHINEMIALINTLLNKGHAYVGATGDVYFAVTSYQEYGQLSKRNLEEMQAGARVEVADDKKHPGDFVLWKLAKVGEPSWPSPWGAGRPGWHIECSAMSLKALGKHFDLHIGGIELKFPHHENEIAQSECANGCKFVNTWLHFGHVQKDKEKMSKSLNNFVTIKDFLTTYDAMVLKFFILSSHYRSPIDFSTTALQSASNALARIKNALHGMDLTAPVVMEYEMAFKQAMDDDFNTPVAIALIFDLVKELNKEKSLGNKAHRLASTIYHYLQVLGLQFSENKAIDVTFIEALLAQREQARLAKDWGAADKIRAELLARGIVIEDTVDGPIWKEEIKKAH